MTGPCVDTGLEWMTMAAGNEQLVLRSPHYFRIVPTWGPRRWMGPRIRKAQRRLDKLEARRVRLLEMPS